MRLLSGMAIFLSEMPWPLNVSAVARWRREIASMTLFHKLLLTRPPPLDSCLFPFASTLSGRSMRKPHQLILPEAHTSKYINSFFYRSSPVWNSLPAAIQNITCKTRETAARIVLEDDIFRAMTRQVQYMAIHCTLRK